MPYLIDGNNLMGLRGGGHANQGHARRRLIQDLARFVAVRRAKVQVVFDGAPDADFPDGRRYKSVQIMYARPGSDADTRIKALVDKSSYKRDLVVISSDRDLSSYVSRRGARVMSSDRFKSILGDSITRGPSKPGDNESVDLDDWLDYFGQGDETESQ